MNLEQKVNYQLNKHPAVKKVIKRAYQTGMYAISRKIKSEGNILRISPDDKNHEYFFGYYDKSPWDITDRYMLCMRANNTWSDVSPREKADILLIDTQKVESAPGRVKKIGETRAWNVQQSCMLQWLGPDFSNRVLYNDFRDGKYVSVILTLSTMGEKVIPAAVYSVSADGKFALTLDFSRLYELRPGYGYYNILEETKGLALPETTAIWRVDLETGEVTEVLKYTDFANFQPRPEMKEEGTVHKVNHIMFSPNGKRFMVLYRWFNGARKYTRLITCNIDGTDMYVLSDDNMVSHCFWRDDEHIIAFENKKKGGTGYYLMKDKTQEYYHCWPEMTGDGHPSFSPDRSLVVTDTYPDRTRVAYLKVMDGDVRKGDIDVVAKVFVPFRYDNDTRCDLHPRWNHTGDQICFDGVFEGHRGLYVINVSELRTPKVDFDSRGFEHEKKKNKNPKYSIITPMYNSFRMMGRYFDSLERQTNKDFEVIVVDDCSTDDSYTRVCEYARNTLLRMTVLNSKNNAGPGNARNIGIENAKGDWVLFIDSDDFVDTCLFQKLDESCVGKNDIVLFDFFRVINRTTISCKTMGYQLGEKVDKEKAVLWMTTNVCGKVYSNRLLKECNVSFPDLTRFEDWVFVIKALHYASRIIYVNRSLYYYVDNKMSIVHTRNNGVYRYSKEALSIIDEYLKNYSPDIKEALYIRELLYITAKEQLTNYNLVTLKNVTRYVEEMYPTWRENQYIKMFSRNQKLLLGIVGSKRFYLLKILGRLIK